MPKAILYAIRSLYISVIFYFAANSLWIAQIGSLHVRSDIQFMLFLNTLAPCAIYCLLVSRISERGQLALILLSIVGAISAIGVVANVGILLESFKSDLSVIALEFGARCLQTGGLALLFVPTSREWLRQQPRRFW
jgi:hypothetical protein